MRDLALALLFASIVTAASLYGLGEARRGALVRLPEHYGAVR